MGNLLRRLTPEERPEPEPEERPERPEPPEPREPERPEPPEPREPEPEPPEPRERPEPEEPMIEEPEPEPEGPTLPRRIADDAGPTALYFEADAPLGGDRPTFPLLYNSKFVEKMAGSEYHQFGIFLLKDDEGNKVRRIETAKQGDPKAITEDMLREWLQGSGAQPVTWDTLIKCANDAGVNICLKD